MKLKKTLALALGLILFTTSQSFGLEVERIAGVDRYDTALKSVQKYYNKADGSLAVLASGSDFKTALYGSYMANALKVPFYITPSNGLKTSVYDDMIRTGVERVYLMGSANQTNKSIENYLISKGIKVTRFNDNDEFEGNVDAAIFETFFNGEPRGDIGRTMLVNTNIFPDLLSVIPFASSASRKGGIGMYGYNNEYTTGDGHSFIIGGNNSIPYEIGTFINDSQNGLNLHYDEYSENTYDDVGYFVINNKYYTGRISGNDRYKTSIEIAKAYSTIEKKSFDTIVLVDGTNYPDALSSGVVATKNNTIVLLTQPKTLNKDTKRYLQENNIKKVIIVGGENSVSKNVENELKNIN